MSRRENAAAGSEGKLSAPEEGATSGTATIPARGGSRANRPAGNPFLQWMGRTAGVDTPVEAIQETESADRAVAVRERAYRWSLAGADVVAVGLAMLTAGVITGAQAVRWPVFVALLIVVPLAKVQGLYDRDELLIRKTTVDEVPRLFQLATLLTVILWLFDRQVLGAPLTKPQAVVLLAGILVLSALLRRAVRAVVRRSVPAERCLFIGDAESYERLRTKLAHGTPSVELIGRMSLQRITRSGSRSTDHVEFQELMRWAGAHRVIIEPQVAPPEEALEVVRAAKAAGLRVSLLPRVLDVVGSSVVFDHLDGLTILGVRRFRLSRSSLAMKRAFDLASAGLVLLFLGPLMALIALAIKLDSRGPVLFRQTRIGRNGRAFSILKFRTMCADAEAQKRELAGLNEAKGGLFKIADDPRVTRVGRVLRRASLDELPQLFNVLRGDMSVVGPRPLVVDEDERIKGWDRRRLHLTPGMTGPWQIAGSARVPLHEMVKIDYLYVANWSLWEDVKLLLRTVPYVLSRRGL